MGLLTSSAMILVEPPTRLSYTIPGDPVPSQPAALVNGAVQRKGRERQRSYRQRVQLYTRLAVNQYRWHDAEDDVEYHVTLRAYVGNRRTIDCDNIAKSALDGIKEVAFPDDRQVVRLVVEKHLDAAKPRLEVEIERIGG